MKKRMILSIHLLMVLFTFSLLYNCGCSGSVSGSGSVSATVTWNGKTTETGKGADQFEAKAHACSMAVLKGVIAYIGQDKYNANKASIDNVFIGDYQGKKYGSALLWVDNYETRAVSNWDASTRSATYQIQVSMDEVKDKLESMGLLGGGSAPSIQPSTGVNPPAHLVDQPEETTTTTPTPSAPDVEEYPESTDPLLARDSNGRPLWIDKRPEAGSMYYFIGSGLGNNEVEAKQSGRADAIAQVIFRLNATITANSDIRSTYRDTSSGSSSDLSMMKRVQVSGTVNIKNLTVRDDYVQKTGRLHEAYVLVEIPEADIKAYLEEQRKIREELANTPTMILAYTQYLDGTIDSNPLLKTKMENFYKMQGYKIVSIPYSPADLSGNDVDQHIKQITTDQMIKDYYAVDELKKIIICAVLPGQVTPVYGRMNSVRGHLHLREIKLKGVGDRIIPSVESSSTIEGKGFSVKYPDDKQDIINNLVKYIIDELEGKNKPEGAEEEEEELFD